MSVVQEVKGTFREITSDVTGVISIVIGISVFTFVMPMLLQLTSLMKGFQQAVYKQPTQPLAQTGKQS